MLTLRRNPCLFTGYTEKQRMGEQLTQVVAEMKGKGEEEFSDRHLDKSGRLVQRHLGRGNVQSEPRRFLPLQAAGALPP